MRLGDRCKPCARRYTAEVNARRRSKNPEYEYRTRPTPEQVAETKREKYRRQGRRRIATVDGALHNRIRNAVWRSLKGCKKSRTFDLLGYSLAELQRHLEARFEPGMSWANFGEWHIDHIKPIAAFDIRGEDSEQFRACWALENLRPLWAIENIKKGASHEGLRYGVRTAAGRLRKPSSGKADPAAGL